MSRPVRPPLAVVARVAGVAALVATGCSDPAPAAPDAAPEVCAETAAEGFLEVPYGSPAALPLDGVDCAPGGLAGIDLGGRWLASLTDAPFGFELPIVRDTCAGGTEVEFGSYGDVVVHRDDDRLFWMSRLAGDGFEYVIANHACVDRATGELALIHGVCFNDECAARPGRLERFARPAGEAEADGLELVAEWRGGAAPWDDAVTFNVQVQGGLAYLARLGELRVVDVSDPAAPRDRGVHRSAQQFPDEDYNDVKAFEVGGVPYVLLAGADSPILDLSDPDAPVEVAALDEYAHTAFVRVEDERTLAYLGTYGRSVPIYDVTDPAHPVLRERIQLPVDVEVHDLYAERDRIFVNGTTGGFVVLARSDDGWSIEGRMVASYSHAAWVGEIAGRTIAVHGDEGQGAHLRIVDVTAGSPDAMRELATYQTRPEISVHNVELVGSRAYVAYYQDGVRVIDLADPAAPRLAAYHHTFDLATGAVGPFEGAIGIDVDPATGLVYVADTRRGLLIFRETR